MINWDRVDELREDFGEDDFVEITVLFLGEVQERLKQMHTAPDAELTDGFHFIKGGAANLGFRDLVKASADAELAPSREKLAKIDEIFLASKATFLAGAESKQNVA